MGEARKGGRKEETGGRERAGCNKHVVKSVLGFGGGVIGRGREDGCAILGKAVRITPGPMLRGIIRSAEEQTQVSHMQRKYLNFYNISLTSRIILRRKSLDFM